MGPEVDVVTNTNVSILHRETTVTPSPQPASVENVRTVVQNPIPLRGTPTIFESAPMAPLPRSVDAPTTVGGSAFRTRVSVLTQENLTSIRRMPIYTDTRWVPVAEQESFVSTGASASSDTASASPAVQAREQHLQNHMDSLKSRITPISTILEIGGNSSHPRYATYQHFYNFLLDRPNFAGTFREGAFSKEIYQLFLNWLSYKFPGHDVRSPETLALFFKVIDNALVGWGEYPEIIANMPSDPIFRIRFLFFLSEQIEAEYSKIVK